MKSFAYIAILDALLKLLMVYLLLVFDYDRLILYAALYAGEKLLIRSVYNIYCIRNFEECKYKWIFQKPLFKEMASFAGWKLWGNLAFVFYSQGLNLLLNVFFGPVVNAARAAAYYAQDAVANFAINFQSAINPQITKTYASGQLVETHKLIYKSVRLTFCLLLMICLPLIVEAPTVFGLWLVEVPEGSVTFLRLMLVILMLQQSSNALVIAIAATGKIKWYEISLGLLMLTIVPISYIVLRLVGAPWSVFVVFLAVVVVAFFLNLHIVLPKIQLRLKDYFRYAIGRCALVLMLSLVAPLVMHLIKGPGLLFSLLNIAVIVMSTGVTAYYFGMEAEERLAVAKKVKGFVTKLKK